MLYIILETVLLFVIKSVKCFSSFDTDSYSVNKLIVFDFRLCTVFNCNVY